MFRQFRIHPDDADWQRILWRQSPEECLRVFRLLTVTYGTAPAPYLAIRILRQLALANEDVFPLGARILLEHSYVDDNLGGADNPAEATQAREQLTNLLGSAGMILDKWSTNDPQILDESSRCLGERVFDDEEVVSTLGLRWLPKIDCFSFKVNLEPSPAAITKRSMLSDIARLFDPLGWLSPIIITAKILIQELWIRGSDWDTPVDEDILCSWLNFRDHLPEISTINIPRWFGTFKDSTWELHGFSDASERAYAASVYLILRSKSHVKVFLISSKTKVAPIKQLSVAKLELCGALLLARLIHSHKIRLLHQPQSIVCWSDSQIVLAWLRGHPSRWKTFVANRVSEIQTLLPDARWYHVGTKDNPADLASRGDITPAELRDSHLWWRGPSWLSQDHRHWPCYDLPVHETLVERKSSCVSLHALPQDSLEKWMKGYSSLIRLVRFLSYLFKWKSNAELPPGVKRENAVTATHLAKAKTSLIKATQRIFFKEEYAQLSYGNSVAQSSHIRNLLPFLDQDGIIRVGGRLHHAHVSYEQQHPPILPKGSHLTKLIIEDAHQRTLHGGVQLIQSYLRQHYWIVHDRSLIRKVVRNCVKCTRFNGQPPQQQMAPLPAVRVTPSRPFTYTGLDYAGPFQLRAYKGRGHTSFKGYAAIFVCMVVKAVHIEIVSDYTSAGFLAAFRRFTSRRGLCKVIYSDNGTNFQGADAEIQRLFRSTSKLSTDIAATIAADNVEWTYIPPKAPHFGGLWESKVKSFKHHLRRVVGDHKLTFEEFQTVATQIEACINSRPLSLLTADPEDLNALTPGHFLIGTSILALPEPTFYYESSITPQQRWHLVQKMVADFWRRWSKEVLTELQKRVKWLEPNYELSVGDLVLIIDDQQPPTKWLLGRLIECYIGKDGLIRVAKDKTATGILTRPTAKLIKLPVNQEAAATAGGML